VTVTEWSNVPRDILMLQNEIAQAHPQRVNLRASGGPFHRRWMGLVISGYGSADWFEFTAQANGRLRSRSPPSDEPASRPKPSCCL